MIDYDNILTTFVEVAQEAVGSELSQVGPVGDEEPAVIIARQDGPTPDYPYIQLDLLSTAKTSGYLLNEGLVDIEGTETPFFDTHYKLLLQYTVYGGNANKIAHELEAYFRMNRVLGDVENNTGGAVEDTFDVISTPEVNSTESLDVAIFNITFNINDRYVDPATGCFDTVHLDGELKKHEDDPDPLPIVIDVTSGALP